MDGIANLYEALSTQFDLGTLDEFRTKISNEQHRRNLYDAVSDQFDLGVADYAGFSAKIDGYLRQRRSVVPDFLTDERHTQGRTFAEWQIANTAGQAIRERGTVSDEEARRAAQQVRERAEQEVHDLRYKNGPDGKPKDTYAEDLGAGLMAGIGEVAQLPYKAVGAFEDWGSGLLHNAGLTFVQPTNGNGIGRRFVNDVLGGNYFRERTEHYRKESDRYQDGRGILDAAIDGDFAGALGRLGISTAQNAPNLGISIGLAIMGAPELAAETLGAGAAFDKWEEIQHDDSLSDEDKAVAVLGTFLAEYVFEKIGDVRYQKMFQQGGTAQVRREVVRGARSAWDKMLNSSFAQGLGKAWNKVMQIGGESITEMATDIAEQGIEVYLGNQDAIDWRQVGDAGIVALASDGPIQGVHWAVDTHQRRKLTAEIGSNEALTAAAQAQGKTPDQMADLLVRAGHGEELEETDYTALNNYISDTKEVISRESEESATEQPEASEELTNKPDGTTVTETEQTETARMEGQRETAREATIVLDGSQMPIAFSGTNVVYNKDGSIDHEHSSKIFLQDANGNVITGGEHDAMLEALDAYLIQEKRNGEELQKHDTPLTQEEIEEQPDTRTPEEIAADEAAAEQARIEEVSAGLEQQLQEKGDKVMDSWSAEEQFIYTMTHSSIEDAMADAQEALETAKADKNPTRRRKRMQDIQRVIDQYGQNTQETGQLEAQAEETTHVDNAIRPIGVGDFGPIYDQFIGKPQEAIAFLMEKKDGECLGALSHPEIGPIDLVWGIEGTGASDGYGLSKLVAFHPEVLGDLQGILNEMHVTQRTDNRVQLESEAYQAGVRLTWNNESKTWLLTAFEKQNSVLDKTTDTGETANGGEGSDTALPQDTVSGGKGTTNNSNTQISEEENAEKVDLSAENIVLMYNGNRSNYVFCRKEEDGKLIRLDTGKPLEMSRNGRDTAWQEIGKRLVYDEDGNAYYLLSTLSKKELETYSGRGGKINVMPIGGGEKQAADIGSLLWEDKKRIYKRSDERRNQQYSELRKTAKTLDDIADYVVLDYTKDGVKTELTLRDLLRMFSTVDEDMNRIYIGDKRYTGIIDKLLSDMGKDADMRASLEDILNDRIKEAAMVWNGLAEEGEKVKETQTLPKKIRNFIDVLDKRGWVEKANYFAGRVVPQKRTATKEDYARYKELREAMKNVETMDELQDIQREIARLRERVEFNVGKEETNEEERAQSAATEDIESEENGNQEQTGEQENTIEAQIAKLEAEHQKTIERLAMARERNNTDMEEMLLEKANEESRQILALRQQAEFHAGHTTIDEAAGKRTIGYLRDAGVDIIELSAEEADQMISEEQAERLQDTGGVVYGFARNGKIYVISGRINPNTPVHEYTHLWAKAFAKQNPKKWASIVSTLKQTPTWKEVEQDANYASIRDNEQAIASEVLARLTGEYWGQIDENGKSKMDETFEKKALLARIRSALRSFWKQVGEWLGVKTNARQDDFEARLQELVRRPIIDLMETEFDKKFKKMQEGLDKGGVNVLSLQQISELTDTLEDDIRQGNRPLVFERIPHEALESGLAEQRTLAEALTVVARRSRRQSRALVRDGREVSGEEIASRDGSNTEMLLDLIAYAKEKGIWYEDVVEALDARYGRENRLTPGAESEVWQDLEHGVVVKAKISNYYETMEEFLEGMVLNNWLFNGNKQHIIGFGIDRRSGTDGIRVIYETPYVNSQGNTPLTQDEKDAYMADFGFEKTESAPVHSDKKGESNSYTNGVFIVGDLHNMNIVRDSEGEIRCTDPIIRWVHGEHYKEQTAEQEERDASNEEALDALFDEETDYQIGDPNPRNISQEVQDAMEKRKREVQEKNENVHTVPAERLEGSAKLIYQLFDNTHGLYLLQRKINQWRMEHGKAPIPDSQDVRSLLNRCSSAIASRITLFDQRESKRLKEVTDKVVEKIAHSPLAERFKQDGLEEERADGTKFHYEPTARDLLERYLVARDNIERAELGIPTRGEREFTDRMGISMTEYATLFQEQFSDSELNELWEAVRGCTNKSIRELLDGHIISQEVFDEMSRRQFYVPEKDFAERETNDDLQQEEQTGRGGRNRKATAVQYKAEGGNTLATNILANIVHDTKNSISVAQENLVRKAMYDMMQDNLDYSETYGIPRPAQVWFVRTGATEDGQPIYERRTERPSQDMIEEAELIRQLIKQQQERLADEQDPTQRASIRAAIESLRGELPIVSAKQASDGNQLADTRNDVPRVKVYVNGQQYEMTFDGMQEVADALNGVYDLRGSDATVRRANALVASLFTTYNPTFFAVNIARDTPYIIAKGYSQYGVEFVGHFTKALTTDGANTRKPIIQYLNGKLDENTPDGRLFYNFIMRGGNTGYSQMQSIREIKKEFEESSFGRTSIGRVFDIGAKLNEYSELLTRFAAYKALIESGYSENDALNGAKNLSVNFNRRGAGQKFLNYFNSLSMFSNAAIQGTTGFFRAFDNGKNASRAFFGLVFMPAFLGFMNTLLCPDDDDDEYIVSDFYRDNYCVLGSTKIPLPEQFRPFWSMGVNIAMGMQGRRNGGQIAKSIAQSFTQYLMPVPPAVSQALMKAEGALAGDEEGLSDVMDVASTLMLPQFASGVQEIAHNKDFMGNTIRKYDLGAIPQYKLGENEAALYQDIAKFFYWANGGDTQVPLKYKKGSIDEEVGRWYVPLPANVNPKEVHKGLGILVPAGWLNIACSIYGFGKAAVTGDDSSIRAKDIPLVGTFYRPEDKSMFRYALYKEMKRITTDYEAIKKEVVKQYAGEDEETRAAIKDEVIAKMKNAEGRGFNPAYWGQLIDAYKATSVYDIAHKLGKTESELREAYPELESLDDFQKLVGQLMNQELMEYHGIEHHIPWLQEQMRFWKNK